jgi:hypothetical protein
MSECIREIATGDLGCKKICTIYRHLMVPIYSTISMKLKSFYSIIDSNCPIL